jgi:type I restriction enzyme S subunit
MVNSNLPDGWEQSTLGEIADLIGGGTPSRQNPEYFTGDIVWLTPTEIPKTKISVISDSREKITQDGLRYSSARLIPKGSVLMTSRASIGYVAIAGTEVTTNQGFASFIPKQGINNFYLAYWLWANADFFIEQATGTTFKEITKSKLRNFSLPIPPLPEQERIVNRIEELFSDLEAGVAALERVRAGLKRYKASVLKAACEGRLTPSGHSDAVPVRGELPEGWRWTTVGEIGNKDEQTVLTGPFGSNLGREDFIESGVAVLTIGCLTEYGLNLDKAKYISEAKANELEKYRVREGDLLFSRMATVGRAGLVTKQFDNLIFNYHLMRLRLDNELIDPYYFLYYVRGSKAVTDYVKEVNHGATRDGINTEQLLGLPVSLPPLEEQRRIVAEVERRLSVVGEVESAVEAGLARAARLRQAVLRSAFEGRLT